MKHLNRIPQVCLLLCIWVIVTVVHASDKPPCLTKIQKAHIYPLYSVINHFVPSKSTAQLITRLVIAFIGVRISAAETTLITGSRVDRCRFSFDDQWIVVTLENKNDIQVWKVATGECQYIVCGHKDRITQVRFTSDDSTLISSSADETLMVWDVGTGGLIHTLRHNNNVWSTGMCEVADFAVNKDNTMIVSISFDRTMKIWSIQTGICQYVLFHQFVRHCYFYGAKHQTILAVDNDGEIGTWELTTGRCTRVLLGHTRPITRCMLARDETRLVTASHDPFGTETGVVKVWDLELGPCLQTYGGHTEEITDCCLVHGNTWVASNDITNCIHVWRVADGQRMYTLARNCCTDMPRPVWIRGVGECLVTSEDNHRISIIGVTTGKEIVPNGGDRRHTNSILAVDITSDGRILMTGSEQIKLWQLSTK